MGSVPKKIVVAVPARLESSRLPNKVLADIGGQPMVQRVLERCQQASGVDAVVLCTDSAELQLLAEDWGFPVLMTAKTCSSGSERIASVADALMALAWGNQPVNPCRTAVINVQGDQPFLDPKVIEAMVAEFQHLDPLPCVVTPIYTLSPEAVHNPNVVKALVSYDGRAIYFSRSAIPHVRDVNPRNWHHHTTYWGHVGMYGYRGDVLETWNELPTSSLENLERLEQLRLIEAGYRITTIRIEGTSLSVDTAEQLEQARRIAASPDQYDPDITQG